jgi:ATP synthase protein I
MSYEDELKRRVERQARRMQQAEKDQESLLSQTVYIGTLGLLFVLPIVAGAYLGEWLDELLPGYSEHWTVSLILLGVMIGFLNVYLFIRE